MSLLNRSLTTLSPSLSTLTFHVDFMMKHFCLWPSRQSRRPLRLPTSGRTRILVDFRTEESPWAKSPRYAQLKADIGATSKISHPPSQGVRNFRGCGNISWPRWFCSRRGSQCANFNSNETLKLPSLRNYILCAPDVLASWRAFLECCGLTDSGNMRKDECWLFTVTPKVG